MYNLKVIPLSELPINTNTSDLWFVFNTSTNQIITSHQTKGAADKSFRKLRDTPEEIKTESIRYTLQLTEKQALILISALDLYSRIGMGQIEDIANIIRLNSNISPERIIALKDDLRNIIGEYYRSSLDKINDCFRIAFDIQQVIRHRLAWDRNPNGGLQVDFDSPMQYSKSEPLPTIKKD